MRYSEQSLQTFRLRNFKAVRDSGVVKFTPLTVFIGNNGSGKSSLIEGLETFQTIVTEGLDEAMNRWLGYENVVNKAVSHRRRDPTDQRPCMENPIVFEIRGGMGKNENIAKDAFYRVEMEVNASPTYDEIFIQSEKVRFRIQDEGIQTRDSYGRTQMDYLDGHSSRETGQHPMGQSILQTAGGEWTSDWQFVNFDPEKMGQPTPQKRTGRTIKLNRDGSNIGDYLLDILRREGGTEIFDGIVQTLKYVLPYAKDVQPTLTTQLQRTISLQLSEQQFQVPGWLLSTGTLRILALLAVLRHPDPPPLLCIEEIENGLDPRTLNLIVEEIARATQSGKTQVVCTTHSPYFLDLLPLSSIVVVERDESGQPTFTRPDEKSLGEWATKFAPGQLYTMSQLTQA